MRYAELFDGTVLEFPDQTPDEVITRVAQEETAKRRPPPAPPSTERSGKEAFTDIGAALVSGTGKMLAFPGQFVSLIPGLRGVGTALASPGEALAEVGEGLKSQGLKVREALRSEAISEAEKDGILSEFATAITSTIKDPALISTFVTEQLPNFLPPALIGRLVGKLGVSAIKGLTGEAAEQAVTQAQRRAVGAAIGTGAVMQSSDIGSEAYRRAYEAAVAQGKTPEEAEAEANSAARIAAGGAFGTSLVAQRLPGARAIEQRLAKVPGTSGRLAGGLGEATSETLEEAGGQLFQNIGVRTVDPTQSLTQGVGAAAGLGLLGGGFFGTLLSKKAAPETLPGQLPGETLEQSISRLVSQREQLKEPPVPKDIISDEDVIRLAGTLNDQGQPVGYGLLTQYEERLKQLPESPEQQRALEVASSVKERLNIESIQRQQNAYSNIITYKDMKDLGFAETDPLYESLVGKNLGVPDEATQVLSALNNELGKEIPSERRELVGVMLESAQSFLDQVPGSAFYAERKPRTDLRGDGAGAEVSGQRRQLAPEEPLPSEAAGLAVPESGAGQPDAREAEEQRPLRFETSAGQVDLRESGDPVDNSGPILYASPEDVQKIRQDIQDPKNTYQVGYAQSFETGDMFTPVTSLAEIPAGAPAYVATVQRATGNIINSYPASTIPEAGSIPVQKRYKPGLSTINIGEPITRVLTGQDIVTPKMLESLGIKRQSAVAKRILGKEVKSPEVKRELSKRSLREEVAPEEEKAAPEVAAEAEEPSPKEQIDAINRQLESLMKRLLNQYGLKDIEVKIVKDLQAKGEFSGRLIKLADDTDNPLLDLKHEAVHALKELGFFTRGQWEALKNRASQEWIQTYLKDAPYTDTVSRYDAYKSMFEAEGKSPQEVEEALIEEAIADAFSFYAKTRPPSGLLSAINTRLKNLFKALKEFLNLSQLSAEDIFGRIEEGKLPSKAEVRTAESEVKKSLVTGVPRSTRAIMESSTPFAQAELGLRTERPKGATGANNVRDIARALNEQTISNFGGMTRNDLSAANANDLARALADEVGYQLRATATTGTGLGWYSNNYPRALDKLDVRFPELKTNKTARSVFTACVAVSSNGEDVSTNIKNAILMYEDVRDGREIRDIGARRADALNNNKAQITALLDRYGDNFTAELLKTTTVKDMNAQLRAMGEDTDSSYLANTTVPIAAIYFGPKLGAFYANLMGAEGYLTMDMWWTRTMNRMRGLLMPSATDSSIAKFREMMGKKENEISREDVVNATQEWRDRYEAQGYETDLEMLVGAKEPAKKAELPEWTRKARRRAGPAFEQLEFDHRAQKMANTIWKNEREMLQEAPFTGTDRAFMYKVARDAQKILKQEGIDLSLADIQAAIWYYEKRLYAKLSGRIADDIGYDEAITRSSAAAGPAGPSVVFPDKPNGGYVPPRQGADVDQVRGEPEAVQAAAPAKASLRTDTPEFKRWFKDSKIVTGRDRGPVSGQDVMSRLRIPPSEQKSYWKSLDDAERNRLIEDYRNREGEPGKPKVMYHGTAQNITRFRPKQAGAIFVSPSPSFAESYSSASASWMLSNFETLVTPEIVRAAEQDAIDAIKQEYKTGKRYANGLIAQIKSGNPVGEAADFLLKARSKWLESGENIVPLYVSAQKPFDPDSEEDIEALKELSTYPLAEDELRAGEWRYIESPRIQELIKEAGFDSFYVYEGGVKNLAVYSPDQLKSIYNVGAFGQRPVTAEEAERLGMTEQEAAAAQTAGDIKLSLRAPRSPLGFYSELENKVADMGPNQAPPAQWKTMIKALPQKGVKPEEIEWSGVNDWLDLQEGKVKKDDLINYLRANGVQVEEVVLGKRTRSQEGLTRQIDELRDKIIAAKEEFQGSGYLFREIRGNKMLNELPFEWQLKYDKIVNQQEILDDLEKQRDNLPSTKPSRYGTYTLPGGENYREVLLTLPTQAPSYDEVTEFAKRWVQEEFNRRGNRFSDNQEQVDQMKDDIWAWSDLWGDAAAKEYGLQPRSRIIPDHFRKTISLEKAGEYKPPHWDQLNVLAHIRINDRTDADGNKVLFVEEIQSDWGQEGKKKGFKQTSAERARNESRIDELSDQIQAIRDSGVTYPADGTPVSEIDPKFMELQKLMEERVTLQSARRSEGNLPPPAPFVGKTEGWLNLALKRIMIMAAEGGYDKVAFINGNQSVDRYNLSQEVRKIFGRPLEDGRLQVETLLIDGKVGPFFIVNSEQELADKIGKEPAERLLQKFETSDRNEEQFISGGDLKVGGEGMKTFYDTIVPTALKKLLPKVGGGQMGVVSFPDAAAVRDGSREKLPNQEVGNQPGFNVTPAMREKVAEGLPKFSLRVPKQNLRSQIPAATLTRMDATVAFREERTFPQRIMDAISPRSFSWFREQAINRYEYLAKLDRAYVAKMGGVKLLADQSAEAAALMSDLGAGLSASAFGVHDRVGGIPVFRNGVVKISNENNTVKGPLAIFAPLAKYGDPEIYRLYQFWSSVKRGARLDAQGKLTPFQSGDMAKAQALEKQFPEFVSIQKEWIKYNDGLVKFMQDTGVITPAAAAEFKRYGDYFPMYKYFEGDEVTGPKVFSSIANVSVPKKYKGDNQPLGDFFENVVRNTQAAIQAGIKNVAAQRATKVALSVGEVVPLATKPKKMTPEVYRVLENGQEKYYAAQDMMMISALKSLNIPDLPFIGFFAGPANLLRNLVTKTPDFMAANMLRDSVAAWVSSGKNITPVISTLINFGKAIGEKSPELNALRNAGVLGGYDYAQGVQSTAETFAKDLRKIGGGRTAMEKLTSPATSLWGALEKGSAASDAATRMEIYKKVLAETNNEAEALFQSLEVMNFNRKGKSGVIRVLTAAVPFLNARIQGLDVLYRAGIRPLFAGDATAQEKARAKTFWIRGSSLMAMSAMYWAMTHDDDEYKRQEQEVRDNYWLLPSMGVKIPIPFEIGVMFKVLPERVMEYSMGDDTGQDFARAMGRHFLSTFAFNPIPQTIVPIVEATTNKSFFTGRPILGQGMEDIAPQFQATPTTSKTATELANFYNSIISFLPAPVAKELQASPVILEHLIQGYTGTMGMYAMQTMDYIVSANSEVPNASKRFEQMPVIKRFLVDPQARGTVTAFYDMKNAVDQMTRTANYLERSMNFEDQTKFVQENVKVLATKEYVSDLEKTMKEFRDQKLMIRSSTMDAETKRSMLDMVEQMELQLTANIRTLRKQLSQ